MSSLADYGVAPRDVVRQPARDDHDNLVICPECGQPVGASKGSQHLPNPDLVDDVDLERCVTLGWRCTRHPYDVVLPETCHDADAPTFVDGWRGVRVRYADDVVRWVAVPEKVVSTQ